MPCTWCLSVLLRNLQFPFDFNVLSLYPSHLFNINKNKFTYKCKLSQKDLKKENRHHFHLESASFDSWNNFLIFFSPNWNCCTWPCQSIRFNWAIIFGPEPYMDMTRFGSMVNEFNTMCIHFILNLTKNLIFA